MKNLKTLFSLTLMILIYCSNFSWAQVAHETKNHETGAVYKSPERIDPVAAVSIRFRGDATGYVKWKAVDNSSSDYLLRYKPADSTTEWAEVTVREPEAVIENLPLDTEYLWEVMVAVGEEMMSSGTGKLSTFSQSEPIAVSDPLFRRLSGWFAQKKGQRPFCSFIEEVNLHPLEKLAFLQAYSFNNEPLLKNQDMNNLSSWYPMAYQEDCTGFVPNRDVETNCRCQVITRASINVGPYEEIDYVNRVIYPTIDQHTEESGNDRTYVDQFKAGAAKYLALRQDESGGSADFSLSNLQGDEAAQGISTTFSEIKFLLGCIRYGGFSTDLPKDCTCDRPLDVEYEYTTSLHIKARKKGCIFSKGAAAQAEDFAFVVARNLGTGELTPLDAGHAMIGRRCSSSWNPEFWINTLNVLKPVFDFFLDTQQQEEPEEGEEPGPVLPTEDQVDSFWDAITVLAGTPFSNNEGYCSNSPLVEEQTLVSGIGLLTLSPNQPMEVILFSNHYLRTRGYGCYEAQASVASDYYLVGVVESGGVQNSLCCSDKVATYVAGSIPTPGNAGIQNDPVNNINNRIGQVGSFLANYGDWYDHELLSTGTIKVSGEFDLLSGPSCKNTNTTDYRLPGGTELTPSPSAFKVYPTSAKDQVTIAIPAAAQSGATLRIYSAQGQELHREVLLNKDAAIQRSIDISNWTAGSYWVEVVSGDNASTQPFLKI
jgi:hypothetical protein